MGNHSVRDQRAKVREYMAEHGVSYTTALRAIEADSKEFVSPPVLVQRNTTWCDPDCDTTTHLVPDRACNHWTPFDFHGQATVPGHSDVCRAADLPHGRVRSLSERFLSKSSAFDDSSTKVAKLVYAMLLEEQPDLAPNMREVRAAAEAGDMGGVDFEMRRLDRAAVALLDHDTNHWWNTVHPRLTTFATRILALVDEAELDIRAYSRRHDARKLATWWRDAQVKRPNWNGYWERESIVWHVMQPALAAVLTEQAGGFSRDELVRVNGTPKRVVTSLWGPSGPPIAYQVVPTTSSGWVLDWERIDADDVESTLLI